MSLPIPSSFHSAGVPQQAGSPGVTSSPGAHENGDVPSSASSEWEHEVQMTRHQGDESIKMQPLTPRHPDPEDHNQPGTARSSTLSTKQGQRLPRAVMTNVADHATMFENRAEAHQTITNLRLASHETDYAANDPSLRLDVGALRRNLGFSRTDARVADSYGGMGGS